MASITIHEIDDVLNERLTQEARRRKKSKNQLIKEILAREMGLPVGVAYADDYREFCGVWTVAETAEFSAPTMDGRQMDPKDVQE
jgi:hypothetical protein